MDDTLHVDEAVQTAVAIAQEAGALLRRGYRAEKEIRTKSSDVDLLTQYDTAAEALISERLQAVFPAHGLHGEEGEYGADGGSAYTWYIDPLDGTNNFAHGFPTFCVSLALYEGDQPLLGVIYDPLRDECFYGIRGGGAFLATAARQPERLAVSSVEQLLGGLVATGFPYDRHSSDHDNLAQFGAFLKRVQGLRRAGSAALDLAYVAAGRLDGYWEYKLNSWDVAAGVLLVTEAGGRVSGMEGQAFKLADKVDLIASNSLLHAEMAEILRDL